MTSQRQRQRRRLPVGMYFGMAIYLANMFCGGANCLMPSACAFPPTTFRKQTIKTSLYTNENLKLLFVPLSARTKAVAVDEKGGGDDATLQGTDASVPTKKPRKKVLKDQLSPTHWVDEEDPVYCTDQKIQFTVRGNPLPLRRHRTSRGFMYNPSQKAQDCFRKCVVQQLGHVLPDPPTHDLVRILLVFYMKRPNDHFRSGKRGPGRLKTTAPPTFSYMRTDVDNLAKFVLDSLNQLCFVDDNQVVSLHVTKLYDNRGHCLGSTDVCIERVSFLPPGQERPSDLWVHA